MKNGDHGLLRMINTFILCDLFENFRNIMQQTEKKALSTLQSSFNDNHSTYSHIYIDTFQ